MDEAEQQSEPVHLSSDPKGRRDVLFKEKDAALRRDVRALGIMVGKLLVEQDGEVLYDTVEAARRLAIGGREGSVPDSDKLKNLVRDLPAPLARNFVRAFSTYFQVVNTAEQVHRIRRRREYLKDDAIRQPGAFDDTMFRLRDAGYDLSDARELLGSLQLQPIFTPNPTETTRRTILRKQQAIVRRLVEKQNPALTPQEAHACFESIRADVTAIWQTEEQPSEAATVADELEHLLFFLTDVIYRVIPPFYEGLENAIAEAWGTATHGDKAPTLVRFGSWVGGDMADNPDVTARTLRETLARQRSLIIDLYYRDCQILAEKLSQSESRVGRAEEIQKHIETYSSQFPQTHGAIPSRYRGMPYRLFIKLMAERLRSTYDDNVFPYESAEQFLADLQLIADSLIENKGENAGLFAVNRLIRRVETFGFHFLGLDVRQNASYLQNIVGKCLGESNWTEMSAEERVERLTEALDKNESPGEHLDNDSKRTLAVFQAIAFSRRKFGKRAIGTFVVGNCHGIDDVLATLLLAGWADLRRADGSVPLDITPLFETVEELARGPNIVRTLLQHPSYKKHLEGQGNHQIAMIGNSEFSRGGSFVSSRWALHWAQEVLEEIFDEADLSHTIFHGRSGPTSRSRQAEAVTEGHLRATENGEAVNERYGVRGIAARTLEKTFSTVVVATALPQKPETNELAFWQNIMNTIARTSRATYLKLVFDTKHFDEYFRLATPIDIIEYMHTGTLSDLPDQNGLPDNHRGVPWGFAWNQSRHLLPAWYGLGAGLTKGIEDHGLEPIVEMASRWPFFRKLMADAEMALAIADFDIAAHYSALAGDLHEPFFSVIKTDYELANKQLLTVCGQDMLLENSPTLYRSIRLRNPYVDPMSLLQVELLQRWRASNRTDEELLDALMASVNGISRGLQNAG